MKKINEKHLTPTISTHIREGFHGWQAGFTIEQQTFYLQPVSEKGDEEDTEEKARWHQNNLEFALNKLINHVKEKIHY